MNNEITEEKVRKLWPGTDWIRGNRRDRDSFASLATTTNIHKHSLEIRAGNA